MGPNFKAKFAFFCSCGSYEQCTGPGEKMPNVDVQSKLSFSLFLLLFNLFLLLFIGSTSLFSTIHKSHCTISATF